MLLTDGLFPDSPDDVSDVPVDVSADEVPEALACVSADTPVDTPVAATPVAPPDVLVVPDPLTIPRPCTEEDFAPNPRALPNLETVSATLSHAIVKIVYLKF